jgi:hypothetical protein
MYSHSIRRGNGCSEYHVHHSLVLRRSCALRESRRESQRRKSKLMFPQEIMEYVGVSVTELSQPKEVKPTI